MLSGNSIFSMQMNQYYDVQKRKKDLKTLEYLDNVGSSDLADGMVNTYKANTKPCTEDKFDISAKYHDS